MIKKQVTITVSIASETGTSVTQVIADVTAALEKELERYRRSRVTDDQ